MFERRRRVRRGFWGGLVLGAAAGLAVGIIETTHVLAAARASPWSDRARFALAELALLACAGALVGAALGVGTALLRLLVERFDRRQSRVWYSVALAYTFAATPAVAVVTALAFAGRRARLLPHVDWLATAVGITLLGLTYLAIRVIMHWKVRIAHGVTPRIRAVGLGWFCLCFAMLFYWADQRVLPHLYPFFHIALGALAFAASGLAMGAFYLTLRSAGPKFRRLADPTFALLVFVGSCASGIASLSLFCRAEELRGIAFARTVVLAPLLGAAVKLGVLPAPPRLAHSRIEEAPPEPLPDGPKIKDADIVLVTIDALRADQVGRIVRGRSLTPTLDALAKRGTVFERAYTQAPHTSYALGTLLCGKYLYAEARLGRSGPCDSLAQRLAKRGYQTAAFFPPAVFYIEQKQFAMVENNHFGFQYVKYEHLGAEERVDQVLEYLSTVKPKRTFLWVHFFEPHEPYDKHEGFDFGSDALGRYQSEVAFTDRALGRLLAAMAKIRPRALVVVAADHGEAFGEHGATRYHGTSLYDEQVRIPLLLAGPKIPARHIPDPVELRSLSGTLPSLVGLPAGPNQPDLGPWLAQVPPRTAPPPAFAELESYKMVAKGHHKLICNMMLGYCELYDLERDPGELSNQASSQPDRAHELHAALDLWLDSLAQNGKIAATLERLQGRARMGDHQVASELTPLLDANDPAQRQEAARLLAELGVLPDGARRPLGAMLEDRTSGPWAALALASVCDRRALGKLSRLEPRDAEFSARAGLAQAACHDSAAARTLANALQVEDITLRRRVVLALGKLRDPKLVPLLVAQLDGVLERQQVVEALGTLGSKEAVGPLARRLLEDPYVTVRQEAARSLGRIGGKSAKRALERALAQEQEPAVRREVAEALRSLGQGSSASSETLIK